MAQKGTFYDPTIICNLSDEFIKEREARLASLGYSEDEQAVRLRTLIAYADERSPEHAIYQRQALVKAAEAGVKLLIGSDSMPIGEIGLFPAVRGASSDTLIVASGTSCRHQIRDGAGHEAVHVARVLEKALGNE